VNYVVCPHLLWFPVIFLCALNDFLFLFFVLLIFLGFCPVLLISIATVDEHCFRQVLMYLCFVWWRLMILIPVINNKQRTILQLVYLLIYDILLIILTGIIMIFFLSILRLIFPFARIRVFARTYNRPVNRRRPTYLQETWSSTDRD